MRLEKDKSTLGVKQRYSTLSELPRLFVEAVNCDQFDNQAPGVEATRKCIEQWQGDPSRIGRNEYYGFRELLRTRKDLSFNANFFEQQRLDTTFVIQSMLFGDGDVALLVGAEEGKPAFGPISHLTNEEVHGSYEVLKNLRKPFQRFNGFHAGGKK